MSRKIWQFVTLATIFLFLTWVGTLSPLAAKIPFWASLISSMIALILISFFGTAIGEDLKTFLRIFDAWVHNSPYAYNIEIRSELDQKFLIKDIFQSVATHLKSQNIGSKEYFSNSNNLIIRLDDPPINIRIRVTPNEDDTDQWDPREPSNVIEISCAEIQIVGFKDRSGQKIQKIINTLHDIGNYLSNKMNGEAPEILITVNRLTSADAVRTILAPRIQLSQSVKDGTRIVHATDAIQLISKNKNGISTQLKEDISFMKPVR